MCHATTDLVDKIKPRFGTKFAFSGDSKLDYKLTEGQKRRVREFCYLERPTADLAFNSKFSD